MTHRHYGRPSKKEKRKLLTDNPGLKPGQTIELTRNHPHISKSTPYWHIDVYLLRYEGSGKFTVTGKEHVACDPPQNEP